MDNLVTPGFTKGRKRPNIARGLGNAVIDGWISLELFMKRRLWTHISESKVEEKKLTDAILVLFNHFWWYAFLQALTVIGILRHTALTARFIIVLRRTTWKQHYKNENDIFLFFSQWQAYCEKSQNSPNSSRAYNLQLLLRNTTELQDTHGSLAVWQTFCKLLGFRCRWVVYEQWKKVLLSKIHEEHSNEQIIK